MKIINSFKIAFAMFSKIPVGQADWTDDNMKYSMCFVPLIGLVIAFFSVLWWEVSVKLGFNNIFYGSIASLIPLLVTGGIHMDGFCDVVDALSSYGDKNKRLEILKDPHVGAFAIIWTAAFLIAYAGVFCQVSTVWEVVMLGTELILSRAVGCLLAVTLKNAKNDGTLYAFTSRQQKGTVAGVLTIFIFASGSVLCMVDFLTGLAVILSCALTALYFRIMAYKNFGGITGDMAGFFIQTSELVMALCTVIGIKIMRM